MDAYEHTQGQEWERLYAELTELLGSHGKQDPFGDGDFWIVDDNYGSPQHKVCVTQIAFITRPLAIEVQRRLRKYSLAWEVLFSLDGPGLRPHPNDMGVTVRKWDLEELWSVERMEKAFGAQFRWRPKLAS